jgi:cytochrome c-type biogenesis protein CcmH/NrfG
VAESKIWEALEALARAQVLAEGTPEARAIRILTWETQAKIPSLWRSAQQSLEDLARSDPEDVAVHSALGRVFRGAGLSARARVAFSRVLALDPSNREAAAALTGLGGSAKHQ